MAKVATPKVAEPKSKAADQDIGATSVNGDPFKKGASTSEDLAKLSGDASTFKPKPAPIAFLNHDSTADEQPLIVSSNLANYVKPDKGKAKAAQEPIGTRGANFSPSRHTFFSTDMGPDVPFQGGHYVKIEGVAKYDIESTYKTLVDQVSQFSLSLSNLVPMLTGLRSLIGHPRSVASSRQRRRMVPLSLMSTSASTISAMQRLPS